MIMGGDILVAIFLLIFFILVIVGVMVLAIWVFRQHTRNLSGNIPYIHRSSQEDALDILRRRYASGEITKEQFDEMRRDISQ